MPESQWLRLAWLRDSLLVRLLFVLTLGVASAQGIGLLLWTHQLKISAHTQAIAAAHYFAQGAANSIRFYRDLPTQYRPLLIEQMRTMGGTRFFVNANHAPVVVQAIKGRPLATEVVAVIASDITAHLRATEAPQVALAWPHQLVVSDNGSMVDNLPSAWVDSTLLIRPRAAPVVVIQYPIDKNNWLLLAAPMPDPYFLDEEDPLSSYSIRMQLGTLLTVLLLATLMVHGLIKPLRQLATAADAFGQTSVVQELHEVGTAELRRTIHAFNQMQARIQRFIVDRERLFQGISHGLKTPIMRLKLRTEMLDDPVTRSDFHGDLDDLDIMVKSALQSVKDSDILENIVSVDLLAMLNRLEARPILPTASVSVRGEPVTVAGKPLALERAFANLVDNAVLYGSRADVRVSRNNNQATVAIRDFGPGIPDQLVAAVFQPHTRLSYGREKNPSGNGLGLGLARTIIEAHHGSIVVGNCKDGGLLVTVTLPAQANIVESGM